MSALIEARNISKTFILGSSVLEVLDNTSLTISTAEFVSIMGPSGSGKTTLMNIFGCLDRPTQGCFIFDGRDVSHASDKELSLIRATRIGFVFQTFFLLSHLNIYENVSMPFLYSFLTKKEIEMRSLAAIEKVRLTHRIDHKPSELSGGEMQRVAIARALAIGPDILLADEPTGNLDFQTGQTILSIFKELHDQGTTIVMVTHDRTVADSAQRILILKNGKLES